MYLSENWVVCTNVFFMIVACKEKKVEKHRLRGLLHAIGCVKSNGTGRMHFSRSRVRKCVSMQPEM